MNGFLDINGAAAYLKVSPRTLRRRLDRIPHFRTDFGLRFTSEDLAAYMTAFRKEPSRAAMVDLDRLLGSPRKRRAGGS